MALKNLTAHVKSGGCAAKLSPAILDQILPRVPRLKSENVLVGFETSDDAGVYRIGPDLALVQTIDFFTPIVDDPYTYGAVAAANALSDVFAMGGTPISSLSVLCFPENGDLADLEEILRGGADKMIEAGCAVLGGHSVKDDEIKFGYAVTGTVHPDRIWTNAGARPGDVLVLTKPLGTGVISTAVKRGMAQPEHVQAAIDSMLRLNRWQGEVHGCTDVTGFGLMGHAREMAMASNVTLEIDTQRLQFLPGALDYAAAGTLPGGQKKIKEFASCAVSIVGDVPPLVEELLYDPQTSGGLLLALAEPPPGANVIGRVVERSGKPVHIK